MGIIIDTRHAAEYRAFLEAKIAEHEQEIGKLQEALAALDEEMAPISPTPQVTNSGRPKRKPGRPKKANMAQRPAGSPPARLKLPFLTGSTPAVKD